MKKVEVKAIWDEEVSVWIATSEDVPGLVTEAATAEDLEKKLLVLVPELMELSRGGCVTQDVPIHFRAERDLVAHCRC